LEDDNIALMDESVTPLQEITHSVESVARHAYKTNCMAIVTLKPLHIYMTH